MPRIADIESILGLFTARGLPRRILRWHYRSRHQSLIAVSNSQFYENRLFIVPSSYTQEAGMGLRFRHVPDGVFDSSGAGSNPIDARDVAEAIICHAKSNPQESLGVATFSVCQRRAIQDELEALLLFNPDIEEFLHAQATIREMNSIFEEQLANALIERGYQVHGPSRMCAGPYGCA